MLLGLDGIIGQTAAVASLRRLLQTGRLPHALLFHGPEGVGKATTADALAATLLCETPQDEAACGRCGRCRMVERESHPDLLKVKRRPKKESDTEPAEDTSDLSEGELRAQILISQIRELTRLAGLAPREGRRRIFIIDPADRMNLEAQNALLKTLEEPPGRAALILVASRPHLLLPTVRSRCFAVGFTALKAGELTRLLEQKGIAHDEASVRAALSEGRPGRALNLDLAAIRERREEILRMLESLLAPGPDGAAELPRMAAALTGKDEPTLSAGLELMESLLRDTARTGLGLATGLVHADLAPRLLRLAERLGPVRAAALMDSIQRVRGYLRFNTNRSLIAESLLAAVAGAPAP